MSEAIIPTEWKWDQFPGYFFDFCFEVPRVFCMNCLSEVFQLEYCPNDSCRNFTPFKDKENIHMDKILNTV
jgi:hypothetical protein